MERKSRKELIAEYKQQKTLMGVFSVTNKTNGKVYVGSFPNLKNQWLNVQMQLNNGSFVNTRLQRDWKDLGPDAFEYAVLEEVETEDIADIRWELRQMEKAWLERLQPYGDKGYNLSPK